MVIQQDNMGELLEIIKVHAFSVIGIAISFLSTIPTLLSSLVLISVIWYNVERSLTQRHERRDKDNQK